MMFAAKGGHQDLVEFFIVKGANNWDWGIRFASRGGHRCMVKFLEAKMAANSTKLIKQ